MAWAMWMEAASPLRPLPRITPLSGVQPLVTRLRWSAMRLMRSNMMADEVFEPLGIVEDNGPHADHPQRQPIERATRDHGSKPGDVLFGGDQHLRAGREFMEPLRQPLQVRRTERVVV